MPIADKGKTTSGDVGFSASEGLKELLNLEAFQKPTESHPLTAEWVYEYFETTFSSFQKKKDGMILS